ncbi:hypothetical protein HMPREF1529_01776 [Microbacterium sp. oral taxon 186 str. F0373]|uniref:hypothetical protein n=1 Tax=Microbacterium sp. oral taxon 186 TaxID=712383 RepID=UPI00034E53BD|nr:hypothetical protein [Microbacterium sp. oral taxon 186]EPD85161.1 hypothetical protein HMPREF1529_01776 [Microbacterium sp. oral taxon 186 str. F0373]
MDWWGRIWAGWSAWWDSQAWGTVPDWFAAVGAVGALLVALGILLTDRRARRRELAEAVNGAWPANGTSEADFFELNATIYNAGSKPAYAVAVRTYVAGLYDRSLELLTHNDVREDDYEQMPPGATLRFSTRIKGSMADHMNDVLLTFVDGNGRAWVRNLSKGTLKDAAKVQLRYGTANVDIHGVSFGDRTEEKTDASLGA